jgi:hypothetical protein
MGSTSEIIQECQHWIEIRGVAKQNVFHAGQYCFKGKMMMSD